MEIPDELCCVFSARVEGHDDTYSLTIPKRELTDGDVQRGETLQVALLGSESSTTDEPNPAPAHNHERSAAPVEVGDERTVEIEGIGEQGDGIARVGRGYVIIVPDTEKRERVTIEITNVTTSVAFAEVVERKSYYE
ncbi:TRAM domain-containing protein [Haladaptatus sp. DFWS20]|uniref:TRAM domain-containing protein n=1 Tax=Haladaptatus sp. DFWS20 TaxID=3403467 RepID=UPI003EBC6B3B